jgi:hypothetical protein
VREGETVAFNITVTDVENLYGIDMTIEWNNSLLNAQSSVTLLGVETHPGGVLHEAKDYPVIIVEDSLSQETGQYRLVATSQGSADSFNGTGVAVSIVFNVTKPGSSEIRVQSELADHPQSGETTSELIIHQVVNGSVDALPIPEFPEITILAIIAIGVSISVLYSRKLSKKNPKKQ